MSMTDPIADLLTRIRNANMARLDVVSCPKSNLKVRILDILQSEGYIKGYRVKKDGNFDNIVISLKYQEDRSPVIVGIKRVSKPGLRHYVKKDQIPSVRNGLGTAIISTSRGVISDREARKLGVGGEVLCSVW